MNDRTFSSPASSPAPDAPRRGLGSPDASGHGSRRVFALLSIPVGLFAVGVVYLIFFSDFADQFERIAGAERANGVRYAIEHTPPPHVPHLMFAVGRAPDAWDRRQVEAIADLLERSGWPAEPTEGVDNPGLLSRPPEEWSAAEAASVESLLRRFRAYHATQR